MRLIILYLSVIKIAVFIRCPLIVGLIFAIVLSFAAFYKSHKSDYYISFWKSYVSLLNRVK